MLTESHYLAMLAPHYISTFSPATIVQSISGKRDSHGQGLFIMTNYELTYIISPDRAEFEAQKVETSIHENITKRDGNLISHDFWGKQQLAYNIDKHDFGYFATVIFSIEPEEIEEFLGEFQLMPEVMRHLLI